MQIDSFWRFIILGFTFGLGATLVGASDISSNKMTHLGESYASSVSANSSGSSGSDNSSDLNGVNLSERLDDSLVSEYNIDDNKSLSSQSLFLVGNNSGIYNGTVLDEMISGSIASTDPYPGTLQIPYTGLSRYHLTPAISKLFGLDETTYAMLVTRVEPGSPAAQAGIRGGNVTTDVSGEIIKVGGDIILELDSNSSLVRNDEAFANYLQNVKRVGENITLTILRDGQINYIEMTIEALPKFLWYDNKDEGIRLKYPSDWRINESDLSKQDIVKFFSPETTRVGNSTQAVAGVFVKISPTESSLDDVASAQQEGTSTTRVLDMSFTNISNLPGYEIVFYDYADRQRTLKILSVFTIEDGRIYRINFAVDPPRYDDYLPLARVMVESFQFTK